MKLFWPNSLMVMTLKTHATRYKQTHAIFDLMLLFYGIMNEIVNTMKVMQKGTIYCVAKYNTVLQCIQRNLNVAGKFESYLVIWWYMQYD